MTAQTNKPKLFNFNDQPTLWLQFLAWANGFTEIADGLVKLSTFGLLRSTFEGHFNEFRFSQWRKLITK